MPGIALGTLSTYTFSSSKQPSEEGICISLLLWEVKELVQGHIIGNRGVRTPLQECLTPES